MRLRIVFHFIFILTVISIRIQAQVFAPSANDSSIAFYGNDKVFVFNKPYFKAPLKAAVFAVPPDGTDGWVFQWSIYSSKDSIYIPLPGSGAGNISVLDTISVTSGFQVDIIKDTIINTFRAWIIVNDLDVKILNKDENDTLLFGYFDCKSLDLHADTAKSRTYYFNPATNQKFDPGHNYVIRWTTDNAEATTPASRLRTRVNDPPWKDTWYILTVSDRFGLTRRDSVIYKSIQSKAEIVATYIALTDTSVYPTREEWFEDFYRYEEGRKSAPAIYKFDISGSENFAKYEIVFGDGDTLKMGNDTVEVHHEYEKPITGNYNVILTTWSDPPFACMDTAVPETAVEVDFARETNFNMPNVFTPGKGENGVYMPGGLFRTNDVSVIFIDITIFTRTGLKVHQYEGNIRDWKGWDGTIMNSGREAPEGVYYYVITRFNSYQDSNDPISRKLMNGFIHLYRP